VVSDQIRNLWVEILGVHKVDHTSHFFKLGGNLAAVTQLTYALHDRFNTEVTLRELIENPILGDMVNLVAKRQQLESASNNLAELPVLEYQASQEQEALWTIDQMKHGHSIEYQNGYLIEFDHLATASVLSTVVNIILQRHKVLRSVFTRREALYGKIVPLTISLKVEKTSSKGLRGLIESELCHSFALEQSPPIRFRLFHIEPKRSVLFVHYHQILHDDFSETIIRREFNELYERLRLNAPAALPPVDFSYMDYSDSQRRTDFSNDFSYWLARLQGYQPTCLGLEGEWKQRTSNSGARYKLDVERKSLETFIGSRSGVSSESFSILLAAFYVALARYTNAKDLAIGSLVSNRKSNKTNETVGTFLNQIVLRVGLDETKSFDDFLAQDVVPALTDAGQHSSLPLKALADEMSRTWGGRSQNLYNIALSKQLRLLDDTERFDSYDSGKGSCKCDLSCDVQDSGDMLTLEFEYSTDLYKREHIAEFAAFYKSLLLLLVDNPKTPIKDVYVRPAFDSAIASGFHKMEVGSWIDCFREAARKFPNSSAIVYGDVDISYRELDDRSTQLSMALRTYVSGADTKGSSTIVGVLFERSPEMLTMMIAILKAGYAYLPLNFEDPVNRREIILEDSAATLVVVSDRLTTVSRPPTVQHVTFSELSNAKLKPSPSDLETRIFPTDLAYLIYTSGTTGKPKGVMIEHQQLVHYQNWFAETVNASAFDRVDFSANLVFDASLTTTLVSLGLGKCISICPEDIKRDPRKFLEYLQNSNIHLIKTTPSYFNQLIPYIDLVGTLPHLKLVLTTGEDLNPVDSKRWLQQFPHHVILNSYGPTEATVTVSKFQVNRSNCDSFSTRTPIEYASRWCQFYILDEWHRPVPLGVEGELYIAGPILCRGYLNNPEENQRKFIDLELAAGEKVRAYQTGDRCIRFADGHFYLRGRKDSQFKMRGGFRVELEEINSVIRSHPSIRNSVVVAHNDDRFSHLIAYIVADDSVLKKSGAFVEVLRQYLMQQMPSYMIPPHIVCVDEIKLTPSGKVDTRAMGEYAPSSPATLGPFQASGPLEVTMLQVWRQILKQDRISVDSNFFNLGGNSLLAMELVAKLRGILDTDLSFNMIFSHPTIRALSKALRASCKNSHFIRFNRAAGKPNLFLVHPATGLAGLYSGVADSVKELNIYGISNDRFGNSVEPYETLEQMALQYADQILSVHSEGELFLGGFCCGGAVAFEIAKILISRKIDVAGLCLIDSFKIEKLGNKEEEDRYHTLVLAARGLDTNSFFGKKLIFELEHNRKLVANYQPDFLPIDILILKSSNIDDYGVDPECVRRLSENDNGWIRFIDPRKKNILTLPVSHSALFRENGMPEQLGQYVQTFVHGHSRPSRQDAQ
jgi:amino acid adenylation domain-containing protein